VPSIDHLNRAIRSGDHAGALAMIAPGDWLDQHDS
jgi:hypothetical protein